MIIIVIIILILVLELLFFDLKSKENNYCKNKYFNYK